MYVEVVPNGCTTMENDVLDVTGHSFRRTGATILCRVGVPEDEIKLAGSWKSDAWKGYGESALMKTARTHAEMTRKAVSPEEESGPSLVPSPSSRTAERRAPPPGPVMCLVGPPGVGKTSLCRSIAEALGKKFCRVSLGGVRDEAEIRGHRRTYIGSMLGTVLQELARCGSRECVMLLDETDKVAQPGFNSNAQAALLELLDPSQNATFRDHYLGVPFDLSCVTFICTANSASEMSRPLIDRLEMIEIPSYTLEEKREIAKRHLFPRQLKSHCLPTGSAGIDDDAIDHLIECYTKEAGIHRRELPDIVGPELFDSPTELSARRAKLFGQGQQIGVALGLAVTAAGGDVLEIETTITSSSMANGGSGKVSITGQLGEVMRESVTTAMAHLRARVNALQNTTAEDLPSPIESIFRSIDPRLLSSADVHVHFPAGAVPKDGPSAGVAVLLALVSLFTGIPIPPNIATTGEITLTGQVLTIGGVRDKALAAQRAGIDTIIIPRANARTLRASLPLSVLESLDMLFIDHIDEALMRVFKPSSDRRHSRSSAAASRKFVVPVGVDDVEGTAAAIKKAVELAKDGDMISCVHVPRPFPEYLLSSMNDPGAVSAEGEALFFGGYLKSLFEATGPSIITKVRKEVEDLAVEKNLQTEYKLLSPSNNVKVELVAHCRTTGADYVVVGPGKDCSGRMAEWLCGNVRGATVVAVRDHCKGTVQG
ncbi:hypothetical protein FOL47_002257 [Perkinsus chesapeaki]|uniref:Lon proteolytic domain-containing protein n=1 Tax=Perkinsus chesapeaki TaxID=330153 RepID=A0A7J6N0B6_PERCH|nr:hypothetical protein FOL47_002257 [Perkinsus chesapeaki]